MNSLIQQAALRLAALAMICALHGGLAYSQDAVSLVAESVAGKTAGPEFVVKVDQETRQRLASPANRRVTISLNRSEVIELHRYDLFTPGAQVVEGRSGGDRHHDVLVATYATEVSAGAQATLTVGPNGIHGRIARSGSALILRTSEATADQIQMVRSQDMQSALDCGVLPGLALGKALDQSVQTSLLTLPASTGAIDTFQVDVALEADYDTFQTLGSDLSDATAFVLSMFNSVAAVYAADVPGMQLRISFLRIWTDPNDPYSSGSRNRTFNEFVDYWSDNEGAVDRDLAHLIRLKSSGGSSGVSNSRTVCSDGAYSHTQTNLSEELTGSAGTINLAHEIGHDLGSPHTHSCSWLEGPLDACSPPEGQCAAGPEGAAGTIMSYCSAPGLSFHSSVSATIRAKIASCVPGYRVPAAVTDSLALTRLYNSTSGGNWDIDQPNWSSMPVHERHGVTVSQGRVVGLSLSSGDLNGSLPGSFDDLSELRQLDLSLNTVNGPILNRLRGLSKLEQLNLSALDLSGDDLDNLTTMTSLVSLVATGAGLKGSLPQSMPALTRLVRLDLGQNELSGSLAPLSSLDHLRHLDLDQNRFSGNVPSGFGSMQRLTSLDLTANNLTGPLPAEVGQLGELRYLRIDDNDLSGSLPGPLSGLITLHAADNDLQQLPDDVSPWHRLLLLDMTGNQLTSLPESIGSLAVLETLLLRENGLVQLPSTMTGMFSLRTLDVGGNRLESIPDLRALGLDQFDVSNNRLTFRELEPWFASDAIKYAPQAKVGETETRRIDIGGVAQISMPEGGANDRLKWFRDGEELTGQTASPLVVGSFDWEDEGTYTATITNSSLPLLTLERAPVTLTVSELAPASLIRPEEGRQLSDDDVRFQWASVSGASSYQLQVARDSDFGQVILDRDEIPSTISEEGPFTRGAMYFWRVRAEEGGWSDVRSFSIISTLDSESTIPEADYFQSISPNPFSGSTELRFGLQQSGSVRISVFDPIGRLVESVVNREYRAGRHVKVWSADGYPSGIYFIRIDLEGAFMVKSVMIVR